MNRKKPTILERLIKRLVKWLFFSGSAEKRRKYYVKHSMVLMYENGTWEYLCKDSRITQGASDCEITDNYARNRLNKLVEAKRAEEVRARVRHTEIALSRTIIYTGYKTHGGHFVASWASSVPNSVK
jgi:hypothetical protein